MRTLLLLFLSALPLAAQTYVPNSVGTARAAVGGTLFVDATPIINAGVGATNHHNFLVPGNTLSNTADRVVFSTWLTLTNGTEALQRIGITFGGQTGVVFSGSMGLSGELAISGEIWRTGPSSQLIAATLSYYSVGGTPFTRAWQTNTTLQLGTNNLFAVWSDVADTSGSAFITNTATALELKRAP